MKLSFERSRAGRTNAYIAPLDVPVVQLNVALRTNKLHLPELPETEIDRHYSELEKQTHGVNNGFYPLGSCTMKYNPKINEQMASLPGFAGIHPLQEEETVQGALTVLDKASRYLCEITGMDDMTLQPAAGAHGEFTGLLLIKAYHQAKGDTNRKKIIVPDSAHGTNPASATMAGFDIVNIDSDANGLVDLDALRAAVGPDTAGLMLTNPNTVGLFDNNILEITKIIHDAGGLCYYDGANLNAVMGIARPGDMGFDVIHLNLHKTFSTPHGGGGPGSGAVGCKKLLTEFLPGYLVEKQGEGLSLKRAAHSIGDVKEFNGNFLVVVKVLTYILSIGCEGVPLSASNAVLNANYLMQLLKEEYPPAYDRICMHEFVACMQQMKDETGVSALDIAKAMLDHGMHPPTMYFPLIVHEALMFEPTETETKETLDEAAAVLREIIAEAKKDPESMHANPLTTKVRRLDEVEAARNPVVRYTFTE